jgi:hypothetical protein
MLSPDAGCRMSDVNPFATRFIRPGAGEFLLPEAITLETLVVQMAAADWRGQIIGPHGSGKSSLLAALRPALEAAGRELEWFALRLGQRSLPANARMAADWSATTQIVIDGYEQLGWPARWWIQRAARRQKAGLLVTAHTDVGLPTLWNTLASEPLAQRIVAELLAGDELIAPEDVSRCYQSHGGNVREMLLGLYDLYESRSRQRS